MTHDCSCETHDHDGPLAELVTLRDWLRYAVSRFNQADLFYGHGCLNAYDEAAWLLLSTLSLPRDRLEPFLDACILSEEREKLLEAIRLRTEERIPTAYLCREAWLGDFRFHVDERVIIPRSFFGELLEEGFAPWIDSPESIRTALDLCTGSGCLAVLMAYAFPFAEIVAADISADALRVADKNVKAYQLESRIELVQSDVFNALEERTFDFILCNPPYVTAESVAALPPEYLHEPDMALGAGEDGLDVIRRLIAEAERHLNPGGWLAVEVGHNQSIVEAAFPDLPFTWLSTGEAQNVVFLLNKKELPGQSN